MSRSPITAVRCTIVPAVLLLALSLPGLPAAARPLGEPSTVDRASQVAVGEQLDLAADSLVMECERWLALADGVALEPPPTPEASDRADGFGPALRAQVKMCRGIVEVVSGESASAASGSATPAEGASVLVTGSSIGGTIAGPGGTLPNIRAIACPIDAGACGSAWTAGDGTYAIIVAPGTYRVLFDDPTGTYARGYYSTSGFTSNPSTATPLTVPPDKIGIDVELPLGSRISGIVTGSGGGALASVTATACPASGGGPCGGATTSAEGAYTIGGLAAGTYRVQFYDPTGTYLAGYYGASGFTPDYSAAALVQVPPDRAGIDVELPLALHISGTVTAAGVGGLAGISVTACPLAGSAPCDWSVSGLLGTYSVSRLAAGIYRVSFYDPAGTYLNGYYSTSGFTSNYQSASPVSVPPDATGIDVELPAGLHISGTVTGPEGVGLAQIGVTACPVAGDGSCAVGTTSTDGRYSVGRLAAGTYQVQFHDPTGTYPPGYYGYSGFTQDQSAATSVPVPPDATGIDVELPLGLHISGTVTDAGGVGLAGIKVKACPTTLGFCGYAETGAAGTYSVGGLGATAYRVWFSDPRGAHLSGYYSTSGHVRRSVDASPVVVPPDATGIDLQLPPGFRIMGTVTFPVAGQLRSVRVMACPVSGGSCTSAWTASDGTYSVGGLVGGTYRVQFRDSSGTYASGYYSASGLTQDESAATPIPVPPDATGIDIGLPLGLHISGSVRGNGVSLSDVSVTACPLEPSEFCSTTWVAFDGTYSIGGLVGGSYRIAFRDFAGGYATGYYSTSGFTPNPVEASFVEVPPDKAGIDVVLPPGYTVSGTVTGPRGDPASRITVDACSAAGGWCVSGTSGPDGTYVVNGLAQDDYNVSFHDGLDRYASGYYSTSGFTPDPAAATRVGVPPNTASIDVALPGARHIRGRVTGPGGVPLAGIKVTACPTSGAEFCGSDTTAADGSYSAGGLVRGSYEVAFIDPSGTYADGFYNTSGFNTNDSTRLKVYVDDLSAIDVQTWPLADPPTRYVVTSSDYRPKTGVEVTISAQLADAGGNPVAVAGMVVTWSLVGASGSFAATTSTTNARGVATVVFTVGSKPGTMRYVTATDEATRTGTVAISRRQIR